MNSTMKRLSQGCSGIRRKRAKAASKVSYTRLLPMGRRVSGCRASSSGERIGESTITAPPSVSQAIQLQLPKLGSTLPSRKRKFAADSALEEAGFELWSPLQVDTQAEPLRHLAGYRG